MGEGVARKSAFFTRPSYGREAGSWIVLCDKPIILGFLLCQRRGQNLPSKVAKLK